MVGISGQLVTSRTVSVSPGGQDEAQNVTINGLDLDRVRYLVTVSARTSAGQGPETEVLAVGTQTPGKVPVCMSMGCRIVLKCTETTPHAHEIHINLASFPGHGLGTRLALTTHRL